MLRGLLFSVLAVVATGCVINVTNGDGRGGVQNRGGGGVPVDGGRSSVADGDITGTNPTECDVGRFSANERRAIFDTAKANLEAAGTPFDSSLWSDEAKFGAFATEVYNAAGCTPDSTTSPPAGSDSGTVRQQLLNDNGPIFYCGPGHGLEKLTLPHVSSCVNELCREHDACYSMCSGPTTGCNWSTNTDACDEPFVDRLGICPAEPDTNFWSAFVEYAASAFHVLSALRSCNDLTCPPLGTLGLGVCSTQRDGTDCGSCLAQTDRGSLCYEDACSTTPDDIYCYPANCPEVSECFGGYGKGAPGAAAPSPSVAKPYSMLWSIYVDRAVIPDTKPNGDAWDADLFGHGPPDPYVFVDVRTSHAQTDTQQDTYKPFWNQAALKSMTAADLRLGITFEVWDSDAVFDDRVGTCTFTMTDSDFAESLLTAMCDTPGLDLHFYTMPTQQ
jgi:hypothetical protein